MADFKFGAKQGGGGARLTKVIQDEVSRQLLKQDRLLGATVRDGEILEVPRWPDLLKATPPQKMLIVPEKTTYEAAFAIIEDLERRRSETLYMWPGCDKCKIIFPVVIPHPDETNAVLSAPAMQQRTCEHNADPYKTLAFHIPWVQMGLICSEIAAASNAKVSDVKLVRRPGAKRLR